MDTHDTLEDVLAGILEDDSIENDADDDEIVDQEVSDDKENEN